MGKRAVLLTLGPLLVILGSWPLLYIYAFVGGSPPEVEGWEYWSRVLSRMFNFADPGWIALPSSLVVLFGFALFSWGCTVLVGDAVHQPRLRRAMLTSILIVARVFAGAVIGVLVVIAYLALDYLAQAEKQYYFLDYREAIITLLAIGVVIGAVVGLIWAFTAMKRKDDVPGRS